MGCPVVIGLGESENFVASDVAALLPVTRRFMFLEEGDVAEIRAPSVRILDRDGNARAARRCTRASSRPMRPRRASTATTCSRKSTSSRARSPTRCRSASPAASLLEALRPGRDRGVRAHRNVHIVACGTSYHAGIVARYWIEQLPAAVLRRDRQRIPLPQSGGADRSTLFVTISQSGETADTLAALRLAKAARVPRDARDLQRARELAGARIGARDADARGPEIGVASTKAFTTQLAALGMLVARARAGTTAPTPSASAAWCSG